MGFFSKTPKPVAYGNPYSTQPSPHHAFANAGMTGMASAYPMGHVPPQVKQQASMMMKAVTRDLSNLKRAGILSPQHMMVERWCSTLGRYVISLSYFLDTTLTDLIL
jgi:hypothetical protein